MKTLIITQDTTPISNLTGLVGRSYFRLITHLQKLKLRSILKNLPSHKEVLLITTPEQASPTNIKTTFWDQILSQNQPSRERQLAWKITRQTIAPYFRNLKYKNIPFINTWQTYLTIHLSATILNYRQAIERLIKQHQPKRLIICGSSTQEQLAGFLARRNKIKVDVYRWPDFSRLNRRLLDWLYQRQLQLKLKQFSALQSNKASRPKPGNYLLAASFFRHLKTLAPLHKSLKQNQLAGLFIIDDPNTQQRLKKLKISAAEYFYLPQQLPKATVSQIYRLNHRRGFLAWQSIQNRLSQKPKNVSGLSAHLLQGYLKALATRAFPLACLYLEAADRLIKQTRPPAIFLISDVRPLEVSLGLLAKKYKIPSVLVSPNTILSLDAINQYQLADQLVVVGSFIKNQLKSIGISDKKIHLVGDLRFDSLTPQKIKSYRQKVFQKLQLPPQTKILLLPSFRANPRIPLSEKRQFFKIASQAVNKIPQAQLVIKPHPTESRPTLLNQVRQWGITNALVSDNQELELIELLSASQATLLTWSMTGFESLAMKKPVVVVNPTSKDYDQIIPYVHHGGAQLAGSTQQLQGILTKLLTDKKHYQLWVKKGQTFVSRYIKPLDHQAGQRIIDFFTKSSNPHQLSGSGQ